MSITTPGAPPAAPPRQPGTAFADENGDPRGSVQVTRNVPPKRVMVTPNNTVTYAGQSYQSGDAFLIGEGPVADALALAGTVVIVDHEQVAQWNGKEGDAIREQAARHIENSHIASAANEAVASYMRGDTNAADMHKAVEEARKNAPAQEHDHGFGKYTHADGEQGYPSDITQYRQQIAAQHMARGEAMQESDAKPGGAK